MKRAIDKITASLGNAIDDDAGKMGRARVSEASAPA
jgi:hypothetical protein